MKHKKHLYHRSFLVAFFLMIPLCSVYIYAEESLSLNSSGSRVKQLQEILIHKAYLNDSADGYFGPLTEQAVKEFQEANNLEPTGVADEKTLTLLFPDGIKTEETASRIQLIQGYTKLQSFFINITPDMSAKDIVTLAEECDLYHCRNHATGEYDFKRAYVSASDYGEYNSFIDEYEFEDCDYIEVIYNDSAGKDMRKAYYHIGTYVNGTAYSVEYWVEGNVVGDHYFVMHGWMPLDPPNYAYNDPQEALDAALALYQ